MDANPELFFIDENNVDCGLDINQAKYKKPLLRGFLYLHFAIMSSLVFE
ncbi:hypothetical protein NV377_06850 [Paenibacillus sp. T3-5-0-4]|nr:hypothetical protein [Paenibacillus endoradicis]